MTLDEDVAQAASALEELAELEWRVALQVQRLTGDPEVLALQRDIANQRAWWLARLATLRQAEASTVH